jgi:hypothetical protein
MSTMAEPGMAAHLRARSLRPCQSSGAAPVVEAARARSAQKVACCSTTPARAAACAVLVRTWKPAKPEMTGPAIRPTASQRAQQGLVHALGRLRPVAAVHDAVADGDDLAPGQMAADGLHEVARRGVVVGRRGWADPVIDDGAPVPARQQTRRRPDPLRLAAQDRCSTGHDQRRMDGELYAGRTAVQHDDAVRHGSGHRGGWGGAPRRSHQGCDSAGSEMGHQAVGPARQDDRNPGAEHDAGGVRSGQE